MLKRYILVRRPRDPRNLFTPQNIRNIRRRLPSVTRMIRWEPVNSELVGGFKPVEKSGCQIQNHPSYWSADRIEIKQYKTTHQLNVQSFNVLEEMWKKQTTSTHICDTVHTCLFFAIRQVIRWQLFSTHQLSIGTIRAGFFDLTRTDWRFVSPFEKSESQPF